MALRAFLPSSLRRWVGGGWLALGVVVGLTASAGTIALVGAGSNGTASLFTPITPCRLIDTRAGNAIGPRVTPIGADETYTLQVTGANGQCSIPATATAVVINTTSVNATAAGYLTLYPADAARPNASNLNVVAGQAPTPNLVTVTLSAGGAMSVYNAAGTVDVLGDIAGYYQPAGASGGAVGAAGPVGAVGPAGPAGSPNRNWASTRQIAMLQWGRVRFQTGADPWGVTYDGTSVWTANFIDDTVSRIDPATGSRVDFATGGRPDGIAFDGSSIWVTNSLSNTVSRIVRTNGARVDFPTGARPIGITFDGVSICVVSSESDFVSKFKPSTGARTDFPTPALMLPAGIVSDGARLWVTFPYANMLATIDPATGAVTMIPAAAQPEALVFDGRSIWVSNHGANTVWKIDPATGTHVEYRTSAGPRGMAFDGLNLWVAGYAVESVDRIVP